MKVLYSQIKNLVPTLDKTVDEVADALTLIGFMVDGREQVGKDTVLSLEVRQNRADCLSEIGVAHEVAAYFGLRAKEPKVSAIKEGKENLNIHVDAPEVVKSVRAIEIDGVKNGPSPKWLKAYVEGHGMNSVNLLVDISNYVMLTTGFPSHLLDKRYLSGDIHWGLNDAYEKITTLDGSEIKLTKENELILHDDENILALAGVVGGSHAAISEETTSIFAEMAVYDPAIIRDNARALKIATEAANRLGKTLSPHGISYAMQLLVATILEHGGGSVRTKMYTHDAPHEKSAPVVMPHTLPEDIAGIPISKKESITILKNLRCEVEEKGENLIVTPPQDRTDLELPEDIAEEVIRMVGYDKIPITEMPSLAHGEDITPQAIQYQEKLQDILTAKGFDEIRSQPLVAVKSNDDTQYRGWDIVRTQNAINDEFPELRQSIASGLLTQLETYQKRGVEEVMCFEQGKVFGKKEQEYIEHESLGLMVHSLDVESIDTLKSTIDTSLGGLGAQRIEYHLSAKKPEVANPYSCWDIIVYGKNVGILFKAKPQAKKVTTYIAELDITDLLDVLNNNKEESAVTELTQKLIVLDANVTLKTDASIQEYQLTVQEKMGDHYFALNLVDTYPLEKETRYTFRATYQNLDDTEAKKKHRKLFGLKD